MGNDVQRPNSKLIKNHQDFKEYTSSKLKDIRESKDFWKEKKFSVLINKFEFDEVYFFILSSYLILSILLIFLFYLYLI